MVAVTTVVAAAVSSVETTTAAYGLSFFFFSAVAATVTASVPVRTMVAVTTAAPAANLPGITPENRSCLRAAPFFCPSFPSSYCIIDENTLYFRKYIAALSRESTCTKFIHCT